jgi:uncharacterized lipoprotein YddW (UPF0748 family)
MAESVENRPVPNRRQFLQTIGAATVAVAARTVRAQAGRLKNFVWMRPSLTRTPEEWEREFAMMRASGITGIIPEVYNGRQTLFKSARLPVRTPWLESVIPIAAKAGLEVHAWMWCMPCSIDRILKEHPDWYNVNARGESAWDKPAYVDYYKFLDPARPEVREFVRDTVRELAAIPGLTGVHLDYIRHPDAILPSGLWSKYNIVQDKVYPPYDYGYTDYSRRAFKTKTGIDPMELKDPEANAAWMQYRLDAVVDLVNEYLVPAAHGGGKTISAAVFPGPSLARTMVRQDWGRFKLDAFLPMLYSTFYEAGPEFVGKYTAEATRTVKQPVHSGLFVGPLDADAFTKSIQEARANGAAGVSIFDAGAMNPARWALLAKAVS